MPCVLRDNSEWIYIFLKTHLIHELGCIIRDAPEFIRDFRSFNIRPPTPGDSAGIDYVPACFTTASICRLAFFIQLCLMAFSVEFMMVLRVSFSQLLLYQFSSRFCRVSTRQTLNNPLQFTHSRLASPDVYIYIYIY